MMNFHPSILTGFIEFLLLLWAVAPVRADSLSLKIEHPRFGVDAQMAFPSVAKVADGTILCAFASNPGKNWDSIYITWTTDAGRTWANAVKVMDRPGDGYIADPNLVVAPDHVAVIATFVPRDASGQLARSEFLSSSSRDGKSHWSKPTPLKITHEYKSGKLQPAVWLDDHTAVMGYSWDIPAELGAAADSERAMYSRAGVLVSKDTGRSWSCGGDTFVNIIPIGADEPALVPLKDGSLFMVVRTSSPHPYETRSHDGGRTWDTPVASSCWGYNSPTTLLRVSDGSILRVWDNSPRDRYPLVAAISTDEARSWSVPQIITTSSIDAGGHRSFDIACYPAAAQASDGSVVLAWWERSQGKSGIATTRLDLNQLQSHSTVKSSPASMDRAIFEGAPLPSGRGSHAGGLVGGNVVVAGGTSWNADRTIKTFLNDSLVFDRGIWSAGPALPTPMAEGAFACDGKSLYLIGGLLDAQTATDAVYQLHDTHDGSLRCDSLTKLPMPISAGAGAICDGQLFIAGGYVSGKATNRMWRFDCTNSSGNWVECAAIPGLPRAYAALVPCAHSLYLLGGLSDAGDSVAARTLRDAWRYDPKENRWMSLRSLPAAGYCWSGVATDDHHILLTGRADGAIHKDVWLIDLPDVAVTSLGELIMQSTCAPLVAVPNQGVWLIGGEPDSMKNRSRRISVIYPTLATSMVPTPEN